MGMVDRRAFLSGMTVVAGGVAASQSTGGQQGSEGVEASEWLPRQDPAIVQEMVGVSHRDLDRVRALVERQPALANATIDWGFGDWESALGAASHVGRRDIAELLLACGARASIFSAAMLGQLDVVKAFVGASPGVQRTLGPHGITLLAHAKAGGPSARPVFDYLEMLGDADRGLPIQPLEPADRDAVVGTYAFGSGPRDHFVVDVRNDRLGIERPGRSRQLLHHAGQLAFFPPGPGTVTIAFSREAGRVTRLSVADREVVWLTARRG